jgi:hypothetical protein
LVVSRDPERLARVLESRSTVPESDERVPERVRSLPESEKISVEFCETVPEKEFTVVTIGARVAAKMMTWLLRLITWPESTLIWGWKSVPEEKPPVALMTIHESVLTAFVRFVSVVLIVHTVPESAFCARISVK